MLEQAESKAASRADAGLVDADRLAAQLARHLAGEVRFDSGSRGLYARDASNYRQVPIGVVVPKSADDVVAALDLCRHYGAPILARGGGTSLAGQSCNVAVVLDFSKYMNEIVDIDLQRRTARVQPGVILDHLRRQTTPHNLTFGPDPATHDRCTFGGMIGNNSCGIHSVMAGRTADNLEELDILLYDGTRMTVGATNEEQFAAIAKLPTRRGEIYRRLKQFVNRHADLIRQRFPEIPRRVSGYNLPQLLPDNGFHVARALAGSECTCALALEATVNLVHNPPHRALVVLGYQDIYTAADHVCQIMEHGPVGLEGIDHHLIRYMRLKGLHPDDAALLPEGRGWLLVEFGGDTQAEANDKAEQLGKALSGTAGEPTVSVYEDARRQGRIWEVRESGLAATAFVPGERDTWPGWEDAAVHPARLGGYLREFRRLLEDFGFACSLYGHFGQGCVHTRIDFDLTTTDGLQTYRQFVDEASDLVLRYDGSFSGEHGDGQSRAELLPKMYGDEGIRAFREFKAIWDPDGKMNPGKVVDPYPLDTNLALGRDYHPLRVETHFQYPDDHGDFAHAALRCVGVGKCRRTEGGVMCPSYMVTHEEKHTTRGRARLLFEMLQGDVVRDGFQSEEIKDALDLCLACKGCKGDCPVQVDMATYKAEFLAHYYEVHRRPRSAYAMGWIHRWARLASLAPRLVNWISHAPLLGRAIKKLGGIAVRRDAPRFASESFQSWFARRRGGRTEGDEVVLWPDTFNNYFHPNVAKAAVHALEHAGCVVTVPMSRMCCGRPLYDYGMLDLAKKLLVRIVDELRPAIRRGVCVVGLEPSCVAVFRDELTNLFPDDEDALRLVQQTYDLSDFITRRSDYDPPVLKRRALVHGHCHHKAVMGFDAEQALLEAMGLDYDILDSGCCGMAGSFGFEQEHYDISVACGERVLLPAVRAASPDTLIIANGFSCQEQIRQLTDRRALHLAEVMDMAIDYGSSGPRERPPETVRLVTSRDDAPGSVMKIVVATGVALAACGAAIWLRRRKKTAHDRT